MPSNADTSSHATSQGTRTRAGNLLTGNKTRVKLLADPNSSVRTRENTRSFLDKNGFLLKEDVLSQEALSYMLISPAHSAPMKRKQEP